MAVGGALRAAIKAGNWASAARESRRRARALAQLNASGGIRGGERMRFGMGQGTTPTATVDSLIDRGFQPDMYAWYSPGLRGNTTFLDPNTGTRTIYPPNFGATLPRSSRSLIEAPYEGFRVWPESYGGAPVAYSPSTVPPWMGRGTPPPASQVIFPEGSVFTPRQTEDYFRDMATDAYMSRPTRVSYPGLWDNPDFQYNLNNYNSF